MKAVGMLLLVAGMAIVICAFALLAGNALTIFVLAGVAVQLLGLGLSIAGHYTLGEER